MEYKILTPVIHEDAIIGYVIEFTSLSVISTNVSREMILNNFRGRNITINAKTYKCKMVESIENIEDGELVGCYDKEGLLTITMRNCDIKYIFQIELYDKIRVEFTEK